MMRRVAVALAVTALALYAGGTPTFHPAAPAGSNPALTLSFDELFPAVAAAGGSCADFGMYEANQLDKCKSECQGNRKQCAKKELCDGGKCPPPGYCYKCVKN